jgi:hypothetical protein
VIIATWIANNIGMLFQVFVLLCAISALLAALAKAAANFGFVKTARGLMAIAALLPEMVRAAAGFVSLVAGKPFVLPIPPPVELPVESPVTPKLDDK